MKSTLHKNSTVTPLQSKPKNGASVAPPASGLTFINSSSVQRKENKTGMPDQLKSGVESLSGIEMSDVKVHYNSSQPAQLNAHAYAQGNQIHIAPGQEKHLPHEALHVVQQKQGRVRPTMQMKGKININDDSGLEREADGTVDRGVIQNKQTHQLPIKLKTNSTVVQRVEVVSLLSDNERDMVLPIVEEMGVRPNDIKLRKWSKSESQCVDETLYLSSSIFSNTAELRFVVGHELSHYYTRDNKPLGLSDVLTGTIGGFAHYLNVGWFGGLLSTVGVGTASVMSGGGLLNAFVHAISAGSTIILVKLLSAIGYGYLAHPLAMALAVMAFNMIPKLLDLLIKDENKNGFLKLLKIFSPETLAQLIIEAKADIHSAIKLGAAQGGIQHFKNEMDENNTDMPLKRKGNAIFDPYHPPLSLRVSYLKGIAGVE